MVRGTITVDRTPALHFVHADHLNTPRLVADSAGTTVWRWDQQEPFGNNVPDENPNGLGAFDLPLRFPGQYFDKETGLHQNRLRDYWSDGGRYIQSDPIGLRGGLNTYTYVSSNSLIGVDPLGTDLILITGGIREQTNPFGHSAVAVQGSGVFSYGNSTPLGSSLYLYVQSQSDIRNQVVTIVPTTPEQDAAVLEFFRGHPGQNSVGILDNCTVRSNEAFGAAGISTRAYPFPGSLAREAMQIPGAQTFSIPQGGEIPPALFYNFQRFAPPSVP
jgi:RHS repeat-associated protein